MTLSNDALTPAMIIQKLEWIHSDEKNKDAEYFKMIRQKSMGQPNLNAFFRSSVGARHHTASFLT